MKRFIFSFILLLPILLFFSPPGIVEAECVQTGETCDTFTSSEKACCNTNDVCIDTGQGTRLKKCTPSTSMPDNFCSCDYPEDSDNGKNGFTCIGNEKAFCPTGSVCINNSNASSVSNPNIAAGQPLKGIECGPQRLREPAAPPCAPDALIDDKCTAVVTAFGEIGTQPGEFISRLFAILLGAAGSIALILFMRAGYQIMSARGNPEGIKEGRERLVAAIVGLMFIIFSLVLLEVIGVDLLRIPGFS